MISTGQFVLNTTFRIHIVVTETQELFLCAYVFVSTCCWEWN